MTTTIHSFDVQRHPGCRLSVLGSGEACMLGVHTLGMDVSVYLNPGDLAILSANIDKVLAALEPAKAAA